MTTTESLIKVVVIVNAVAEIFPNTWTNYSFNMFQIETLTIKKEKKNGGGGGGGIKNVRAGSSLTHIELEFI